MQDYSETTNRRITFEYTLIQNINDRDEDIRELKRILKGLKCHINLIPLNPIKKSLERIDQIEII